MYIGKIYPTQFPTTLLVTLGFHIFWVLGPSLYATIIFFFTNPYPLLLAVT